MICLHFQSLHSIEIIKTANFKIFKSKFYYYYLHKLIHKKNIFHIAVKGYKRSMKFSSRKKAPKWEYNLKNSDYLIFLSLLRFLKDNNVYNFFQFVFSSYLTKVTLCADFSLYVLTMKFYICDSLLNKIAEFGISI